MTLIKLRNVYNKYINITLSYCHILFQHTFRMEQISLVLTYNNYLFTRVRIAVLNKNTL